MFDERHIKNTILKQLLHNHPKPVIRLELQKDLNIQKKELILLLTKLNSDLKQIHLRIVGIKSNTCIGIEESEKYYLIQRRSSQNKLNEYKELNKQQQEVYKKRITVFSVLFIEENITKKKFVYLLRNICNEEFIEKLRLEGYLYSFREKEEDEETYINFGWRFKAEYPLFNPLKIIAEIKSNILTEKEVA